MSPGRPVAALVPLLACLGWLAVVTPSASGTGGIMLVTTRRDTVTFEPAPARGAMSLDEALATRRSVRRFTGAALTADQLGRLLWAAQGVTSRDGLRTAPSAGALYPLEVYVATADGAWHYQPRAHRMVRTSARDLRAELASAAFGQEMVGLAPAVFAIAGVTERTERRYGSRRAPRYVMLEAGHAAQNLLLQATAMGLGGTTVGAFEDASVHAVLGLREGEQPLYLIPVGVPR